MPALPSGVILMWSGTIATIPTGYFLCDGNNGTPDLRDRFIFGAGGAKIPGDTGGAQTHTHDFTGDGHIHDHPGGDKILSGPHWSHFTQPQVATGTTDPAGNLPPYYALAYIMKT